VIGKTSRILKLLAKEGEITMDRALALNTSRHDHVDQLPLAKLIECEYVGISLHSSKQESEYTNEVVELERAISLHMFTLPRDENGACQYLGITSTGSIDPRNERVYLRAKGALYLDEKEEKFRERLLSFVVGIGVGAVVAIFSAWISKIMGAT
jgi:hypothetical protein